MKPVPTKGTVARAKAGDEGALTELYLWYKPLVQRFLYYRTGNRHVAEDLTTDVFLRVIEHLPAHRLVDASFQAWVFQIARNLGVDYFRRQQHRDHLTLDDSLEAKDVTPEQAVAHSLTSQHLILALQQLTDAQYDVVVMRFVAEMPIAEVAQALGKSESAVKSLQARGLEALHALLKAREVTYGAT